MVLVLKVISCTMNYNDGLLKVDDLREAQKKNRLLKLPLLIEYVGYCLYCGSHFARPNYEMKNYLEWTEKAAIIISGLGFSGWTDSSPPKPRWDRIKNIDILDVYERLVQKGKKPGFFQLLATQTVNAIWHGLYPRYIVFFVQSALMIAGSREFSGPESTPLTKLLEILSFAHTVLVLNNSCVGFMVLSLHETVAAYRSVYFIGTIDPIVVILLGYVIRPERPSTSKARKEQ
ncbi:Lysophospholipid acyltransferase 1 [Camellia lanceoleosa]|uniref:Lysophospholipid acyltransferase 1 n=1 Tax=Camellia lanceoleosa TaxID=1840588 RepID=A0ACC0FI93_9ERIC|nr:Lysophospholipid acyltransferase 1 [Camellia lanceoleosa]